VANNTALPLLINDGVNGYVVDTKDDEGLSKKINYVYENYNKTDIKQIREKAIKIGDESSWKHVASNMSEFYSQLISRINN
jgi:glycosyltransferase involved in cell wall biosynthesis